MTLWGTARMRLWKARSLPRHNASTPSPWANRA
jgi:hypothetical protein